MIYEYFAPAPRGTTQLLADELRGMGALQVRERRAGAAFSGPLELAYRVCLWSRLASRLLLPLARFPAPTPEALYAGARALPWEEHLRPEGTLAVDCNSVKAAIGHTHYAALKVKDAVADRFRDACGVRPSVELARPDLRINVHLQQDQATVSLDLAGESLHRRGYRRAGGEAPLKENLAAAILLRAGWPAVAAAGGPLVDLMCGSGTLLIEGALIAGDGAPGLGREYFGFTGWNGHDATLWHRLVEAARARWTAGLEQLPPIAGFDADPRIVDVARANADRAGLGQRVEIETRPLSACRPFSGGNGSPGLVAVNPPYGERLGEESRLRPLYAELGAQLRQHFAGWKAAVFTGNPGLGRHLGLKAVLTNKLYNGTIECRLLRFEILPRYFADEPRPTADEQGSSPPAVVSPGAEMFANRLRKNRRILGRWARRAGIDCFRLYDADMPDYALAVDLYQGKKLWAHVQEYKAPPSVDPARAAARRREALEMVSRVLEIPGEQVFFKMRQRQKGRAQYSKLAAQGQFHQVREEGCALLVNFTDYLDTGLFLDHRPTRALIGQLAAGRRFLNLFGYTGTATVHAASGGATSTTTVDLSNTYLEWARRNLERNGFKGRRHALVQADCLAWLEEDRVERFGLIFLDPPTFSNSKRMQKSFDVQRDHPWLIRRTADLLDTDGVLIFSTNATRFRMESDALVGLEAEEITRETTPRDFARHPRVHSCWRIVRCSRDGQERAE